MRYRSNINTKLSIFSCTGPQNCANNCTPLKGDIFRFGNKEANKNNVSRTRYLVRSFDKTNTALPSLASEEQKHTKLIKQRKETLGWSEYQVWYL